MNNVEIEDLYHHDFTTASKWEVFIARLEEIMHEWKLLSPSVERPLKPGDFVNYEWRSQKEKLFFAEDSFDLIHFKLQLKDNAKDTPQYTYRTHVEDEDSGLLFCQKDALNISNDFVGEFVDLPHDVPLYYGIREFLLLVPYYQDILNESRIKILISSLSIAAVNANCEIPLLVNVSRSSQCLYFGVCLGKGTCTYFDTVHLRRCPPHCRYLTGLLSLFKQKIGMGGGSKLDSVKISIQFTYLLEDWVNCKWSQEPPDFDFLQGKAVGVEELGKLPFGSEDDPVDTLKLLAIWPEVSENVVVDSESFTDLEPELAPEWSIKVTFVPVLHCLLGNYLNKFLHRCRDKQSLADVLKDEGYNYEAEQIFSSAFNILTDSKIPSISSVVGKSSKKWNKNVKGPISTDLVLPILYFLFPDAEENSNVPYGEIKAYNIDEDPWKGVKTCAMDSLVWRLAIVAAHCHENFGEGTGLAQLWHEFVQEIRYRWENSISIPGVAPGLPDSVHTCILHQKLQMLNCCIERKRSRTLSAQNSTHLDEHEETESDEEFFECSNEEEALGEDNSESKSQSKTSYLLWNKPTGRLAKHPSLKLIESGDPLYLPITQDPVPKTEDQIEEDAQVMMELGTDKNASEMRARLMSASLLSDMESFKAANPGALLEDFIRWYSPRDWIEDGGIDKWGQPSGHLSARMLIPDNPWSSTWASAQPVPAHRQKRLFDDTREAEKVLHFLASRKIGQIAQLLVPALMHAAVYTVGLQKHEALPNLGDVTQNILKSVQRATKFSDKDVDLFIHTYKEIVDDIKRVEELVTQVNSLHLKFGNGQENSKELSSFINQLMREQPVKVPDGADGHVGLRIATMFYNTTSMHLGKPNVSRKESKHHEDNADDEEEDDAAEKKFPQPNWKEFILRTMAPRPSPTSTPQPQRMYVRWDSAKGIQLAGFFSEDTVFL